MTYKGYYCRQDGTSKEPNIPCHFDRCGNWFRNACVGSDSTRMARPPLVRVCSSRSSRAGLLCRGGVFSESLASAGGGLLLYGERDKRVVLLNVALQNVRTTSEHTLESADKRVHLESV